MKKSELRSYANLIATVGARVRKGQDVRINAELDQPEFVRMVVEECYKAGARSVFVEWGYQPLIRTDIAHCSVKTLCDVPAWQVARMEHWKETRPARIYLTSEDPDGLRGINQAKLSKAQQARYKVFKPLLDAMDNHYQWCIAAVPGAAWAKKIFPHDRRSVAVEKLWDAILTVSRAKGDGARNWAEHNADLKRRCAYLNSLSLRELHYTSSNGTDLRVGLIPEALFLAGEETTLEGDAFNPNIPSEEVFTTPMAGKAEGVVYASRPLSYRGELIENFSVRFEGGRAVEVHAEKGEALLQKMIAMDGCAGMLGECALVPYESPIRKCELLFYNTLIDENAACHLALGTGFVNCLRDYDKYTLEEARKMGVNDSIIHVDFMIGTEDLAITGVTADGREAPVFRNGNWAF